MKKIILTIAVLAALTACSSADKVEEMPVAQPEVIIVEEEVIVIEEEIVEEEVVAPVEETVNEIVTLYDDKGVKVVSDNDSLTLTMPSNIGFGFESSSIKDDFKPALNALAEALKSNTEITAHIAGHTDNTGPEKYNNELSIQRAEETKKYLVSQGVDSDKITVEGFGASQPAYTNETIEGRRNNRRIEVTLTK